MAGLCEMWFTLSRWSRNTLSWAKGLILYINNDLTSVIGIISYLYRKWIKYVNKVMNPFKGSLRHKMIKIFWLKLKSFDNFYIWTSKIMDPTERLAPNINKKLSRRNNLFLIESGNSIFKYNIFNYTYEIGETIARSNNRKVITLEKGRKKEIIFIIQKYLTGEILLESSSVNEIANFLGYNEKFIETYFYWKDKMYIRWLPLFSLNKFWGFISLKCIYINVLEDKNNFSLKNHYNLAIFKPKENNILECTPTTKTFISLNTTHLSNNYLSGRYLIELNNIYPNKDGKYRNLSKFLYDPLFLMKIYNNLKDLKLISQDIEKEWFLNTAIELKNGNYTPHDWTRS